jgi:hypothetical protein
VKIYRASWNTIEALAQKIKRRWKGTEELKIYAEPITGGRDISILETNREAIGIRPQH